MECSGLSKKLADSENPLIVAGFGDVTQINETLINDMIKFFPSLDPEIFKQHWNFSGMILDKKKQFYHKNKITIFSVKMWLEKKLLFELAIRLTKISSLDILTLTG
ncbi:hypothetical protein NI447_01255 [Enterococcus lactis]|nr:hypothetical protein [Enterococcus lactis]